MAQNLYGSDAANLSESQKDTVAALTTLAGSLAGGLAGGNAASALAGGQGAKNEVENNSLNTRAAATLMQTLRACAGRCDVAQLSREIQQQEQYWDKVVAERCGGGGASLAVCASTLNGLQESLSFISSALGMAKTPQERALLLATYNEQVRDINTATAQFEKLGASASVIDVFMTQTAQILPDLALSVGGNGRPALAVKPVAGGQTVGAESGPATVGQPPVSAGSRVGAVVESIEKPELASANGSIVSSSQAARLHMQLSAEQAAGVRAPTQIISYSDHAIAQMASRDSGVGVNKDAVINAFSNPVAIQYVPSKYGPTFRYIGQDAAVVVNAEGKVVTAWATNSYGVAR
ncbi:VENN motif pre-toxin domain-containing protein [Vogesella sp.]|uniref:VENN motif pre-toxin domain-containing protein n=1 Tax=Vogesella sp. TaxID=1904252 RepID=UPI003F66C9F7